MLTGSANVTLALRRPNKMVFQMHQHAFPGLEFSISIMRFVKIDPAMLASERIDNNNESLSENSTALITSIAEGNMCI